MSPKSRHLISAGVLFSALAFSGATYAQSSGTTAGTDSGAAAAGTQGTPSSSSTDMSTDRTSPSASTDASDSSTTATPPASAAAGTAGSQASPSDSQAGMTDSTASQADATGTDSTRADAGATSTAQTHAMRASEIIGAKVESPGGENLGSIHDMVVDLQNQEVRYVVLSHGGILGIGSKLFAYPLSMVETKSGEEDRLVINADKERLENAPGFEKNQWPDFADSTYTGRIDQYYGASGERRGGETPANTVRASDLIGKNFDDAQGNDAGEIEDLIVDSSTGRVEFAIVDFDDSWNEQADGRLVAVPLTSFALRGDDNDELIIQSSAASVDMSHAFAGSEWPDFNGAAWRSRRDGAAMGSQDSSTASPTAAGGSASSTQPGDTSSTSQRTTSAAPRS